MRKIFLSILILTIFSTMAFHSPAISAKEDTAQLTFSKTAFPKKDVLYYTVQKEDVLSAIVRKIPGVTEKDIPNYYKIIQDLNPHIKDLDKLLVGQKIVLPGKAVAVTEEKTAPADTAENQSSQKSVAPQAYRVKKGDNLIRIVHRELHITANTQNTMLHIKSLNPSLRNAHKIYVGQVIRLPGSQAIVKGGGQSTELIDKDAAAVSLSEEQQVSSEKTAAGKDAIVLSPAARLAVIKHIFTQMNANMMTSGNYYLPVSKTGQLTIDCSIIPVVEFDDRTTIFLDLENRSSHHLKKIISAHWSNYHLVKIDAKDDIITLLKKIFKNTKSHEIVKAQKPVVLESLPSLEIPMDWLITKKNKKQSPSLIQGLRFVYENNALLPRAIVNHAKRHSFIITEISPDKGLVVKPEEIYTLAPQTVLPSSSAGEFAAALLSYLKIPVEKDVELRVFNIARDGFNLSIKADMKVLQGDKSTIIFSRNLPLQFVNILQKTGNELIFLSDQAEPAKNMEKVLRGLHFAFASGNFTFSGLDKNQPPYNFSFNGTKIKTDKDIFIVNFDFNQELRGLMQETWSADVIRY